MFCNGTHVAACSRSTTISSFFFWYNYVLVSTARYIGSHSIPGMFSRDIVAAIRTHAFMKNIIAVPGLRRRERNTHMHMAWKVMQFLSQRTGRLAGWCD